MSRLKYLNTSDEQGLSRHVGEMREVLKDQNPQALSKYTAAEYRQTAPQQGDFHLKVWGQAVEFSYPEFVARFEPTGELAPLPVQALLAYYFQTADGSPILNRWVAFTELPDGRFYNQAFQGYTGRELTRAFGSAIDQFADLISTLPTAKTDPDMVPIGDRAFPLQALPRVPVLVVFWQGDEDFPPSYQILFDASVVHYLPTDVCAILGSMLTRKLIAAKHPPGE